MKTPKVSVIVPGRNASATLPSSLPALRAQDWPSDCLELIYVDDASTDGSADVASKWADRVVRLPASPGGPANARNSGVKQSSGEILVFMDSDVLAPPGTLRALLKPLMENDDWDAVFGSYDSEPLDPMLVSQYRNLLHHFVHQTSRQEAATFWSGCGAIRRSSFEAAGGFDAERYKGAMIEDIELGHRMCGMGMKIRLQPSVQVKHLKRWTLPQMIKADIFSRGIPWMRLLFQAGQRPAELGDLNLKPSGALSVVLAWTGALLLALSIRLPKLLPAFLLTLALGLAINLPTYQFFRRIRGWRFTLMIIPLHGLYHLYNGLSVLVALLYRCLIDRPLPGLKPLAAALQIRYWRYHNVRNGVGSREPGGRAGPRSP